MTLFEVSIPLIVFVLVFVIGYICAKNIYPVKK